MGEAAADGAARAHGAIGDAAGDPGEKAAGRIGDAAVLDGGMRDGGADGDRVRVLADGRQLGDARDVDQQRRLGEAQVEHRAQRLAAGQHLGTRRAGEHLQRFGHRRWPRVVEGYRLHAAAAFARARSIASTMRRGVIGETSSSAPRPASASLTALVMAAGGAMAPPSPMPFWPKRV